MEQLFASGSIIDLILVIFAVEAAIVLVYLRRSGLLRSGRGVGGLFANIAAGACLLLAVRAALTDTAWQWVALWIGLSLPFHLADLAARWGSPARPAAPGENARATVPTR